mgnify:CR=1 FL=1
MHRIRVFALLLISTGAIAQFGPPSELQQRIMEIMQSDIRTDAERARDRNRQAPQVLEFFRIEEDMRVIEIVPDAGWYTKILAPLLQDEGKLYVTHPRPTRYADSNRAHRGQSSCERWASAADGGPSGVVCLDRSGNA